MRYFKANIGRLKKLQLHRCTNLATITKDTTVLVFIIDILQVINIMYVCICDIKRMDDSTKATDSMQFVSEKYVFCDVQNPKEGAVS